MPDRLQLQDITQNYSEVFWCEWNWCVSHCRFVCISALLRSGFVENPLLFLSYLLDALQFLWESNCRCMSPEKKKYDARTEKSLVNCSTERWRKSACVCGCVCDRPQALSQRTGPDYVIQRARGQDPMALHGGLTAPWGLVFTSAGHTESCAAAVLTSSSVRLMHLTPCLLQLTHTSASIPTHMIKISLITMAGSSFCGLCLQHL